ncbi:MAG: hypothetical protein ACI837_003140 [Crocinitomicaceae bacterium]
MKIADRYLFADTSKANGLELMATKQSASIWEKKEQRGYNVHLRVVQGEIPNNDYTFTYLRGHTKDDGRLRLVELPHREDGQRWNRL